MSGDTVVGEFLVTKIVGEFADRGPVAVSSGATITITGGGGDGSGDVVGPASSTTGRAAEFADTTGKLLRAAPLTGDGGRPVLNASGVWSDALIGTAIARNTEVTAAVTAHSAATDPHGDRAYADAKVADAINDGTTTVAPSQNAVFDALALKADAHEVRHDFVSPNDYMGTAPVGSATSASAWNITRLAITTAGTTTVTHATNVKWDDRLTATYT